MSLITNENTSSENEIRNLEYEIALLEGELESTKVKINTFESAIRKSLHAQIEQVRILSSLYKSQKQQKKEKRNTQKKKGKNYQEPQKFLNTTVPIPANSPVLENQQQLKRLYKEAIWHVHPDKYDQDDRDKKERANDLTAQLIDIYKSGDLEKLIDFHEHIISGNAISYTAYQSESIKDPKTLLSHLAKKKATIQAMLTEMESSHSYLVISTYADPLVFIEELRDQFEHRISQLKKRTRSA